MSENPDHPSGIHLAKLGEAALAKIATFQRSRGLDVITVCITGIVDYVPEDPDEFVQHQELIQELLNDFKQAQEIATNHGSSLLLFVRPVDAVRFALTMQTKIRTLKHGDPNESLPGHRIPVRIGIHCGNVPLPKPDENAPPGPAKPDGLAEEYQRHVDTCGRLMRISANDHVMLTRLAFDLARTTIKKPEAKALDPLMWVNHGPYLVSGLTEPLEICEVGQTKEKTLPAPASTPILEQQSAPMDLGIWGWRPAVGVLVPNTKFIMEEKIAENEFSENWRAGVEGTKDTFMFRFCIGKDWLESLQAEEKQLAVIKQKIGVHRNVVGLMGMSLENAPYYLMMDFYEGTDLETWCKDVGGLQNTALIARVELIAQVADGLNVAHEGKIVHGRIKPKNILVKGDGRGTQDLQARLINFLDCLAGPVYTPKAAVEQPDPMKDFSVAGIFDEPEAAAPAPAAGAPATGGAPAAAPAKAAAAPAEEVDEWAAMMSEPLPEEAAPAAAAAGSSGTPATPGAPAAAPGTPGAPAPAVAPTGPLMYCAPEVIAGGALTIKSDIYSMGVLLSQMLVGSLTEAFTPERVQEVVNPLVKDQLAPFFMGDAAKRTGSAAALAGKLRASPKYRVGVAALTSKPVPRWVRTAERAAFVLVCLTLLVGGLYIYLQSSAKKPKPKKVDDTEETQSAQRKRAPGESEEPAPPGESRRADGRDDSGDVMAQLNIIFKFLVLPVILTIIAGLVYQRYDAKREAERRRALSAAADRLLAERKAGRSGGKHDD